ncbi:MAG: hypothetical protein U5K75_11035 [Ahrensia sp.]|nr:hypothetical protein [Ahrensia sp.]
MAVIPVQTMTRAGAALTYTAVTASDTVLVASGERTFVHVKNASAAATNVTILAVTTLVRVPGVARLVMGSQLITVPANSDRLIGPIPPAFVNALGSATLTFSATASVTIAAVLMQQESS